MARKPSDRNTKSEILEAYEQLLEERKAIETQLKQLQKEQKDKSPAAPEKISHQPDRAMIQQQLIQDKMSHTSAVLFSCNWVLVVLLVNYLRS
jgi:hypothetical protein